MEEEPDGSPQRRHSGRLGKVSTQPCTQRHPVYLRSHRESCMRSTLPPEFAPGCPYDLKQEWEATSTRWTQQDGAARCEPHESPGRDRVHGAAIGADAMHRASWAANRAHVSPSVDRNPSIPGRRPTIPKDAYRRTDQANSVAGGEDSIIGANAIEAR